MSIKKIVIWVTVPIAATFAAYFYVDKMLWRNVIRSFPSRKEPSSYPSPASHPAVNKQYLLLTHSDAPENEFLISGDKAGFVELWMTANEVREKYGANSTKIVDFQLEGMPSPAINVYLINGDTNTASLTCELRGENVDRIWVNDARFKTEKGIGIGSTLGMLRKEYTVNWISGEGALIARVEALGISFELNGRPPHEFYTKRDMSLIPDDMLISGLFLTGRPGVSYGDPSARGSQ